MIIPSKLKYDTEYFVCTLFLSEFNVAFVTKYKYKQTTKNTD